MSDLLDRPRAAEETDLDDQSLDPVAVRAVMQIGSKWGLTVSQTAALIREPERSWNRLKANPSPGDLDTDQRTRASALVGIYKGLHEFFGEELADRWVTMPNRGPLFNNETPFNLMLRGGIPAMLEVRDYVDALGHGM